MAILGGDLTGKRIAPIVEDAGGLGRESTGEARRSADEAELDVVAAGSVTPATTRSWSARAYRRSRRTGGG